MTKLMSCALVTALALFALALPVDADLGAHILTVDLTLPQPLEADRPSRCIWGPCQLGPRLYHAPQLGGSTLVGWTDSSGNGHVSRVVGSSLQTTWDFAGERIRGLVAHDDGGFAVVRWTVATGALVLSRHNSAGTPAWSSAVNGSWGVFDDSVGDSRLAWGGDRYGVYHTVKGVGGPFDGYYADELLFRNSTGGAVVGGWNWGCSHSLAQLVGYHPGLARMTAICASDCFPQKGLNADHQSPLLAHDGDCAGNTSLQLGQAAAGATTWKVAFNAVDRPCCPGAGVGLLSFDSAYTPAMVWLTSGDGAAERDPVLARLADDLVGERYLVGWRVQAALDEHWLGIVDGDGAWIEDAEHVLGISWGMRDDSLRSRPDGASWVTGSAESTQLRLHRFVDAVIFADGLESGGTGRWSAVSP